MNLLLGISVTLLTLVEISAQSASELPDNAEQYGTSYVVFNADTVQDDTLEVFQFDYERNYLTEDDVQYLQNMIETDEEEIIWTEESVTGMDYYTVVSEDIIHHINCEQDSSGNWVSINYYIEKQSVDDAETETKIIFDTEHNPYAYSEDEINDGYAYISKKIEDFGYGLDDTYLYDLTENGILYKIPIVCDNGYSYMEYPREGGMTGAVPDSFYYVNAVYDGEKMVRLMLLRDYELEENGYVDILSREDAIDLFTEKLEYQFNNYYYEIDQIEIKYTSLPETDRGGSGALIPVWFFGGTVAPYNTSNGSIGKETLFAYCIDAQTGEEYELGLWGGCQIAHYIEPETEPETEEGE